MRRTLKVIAWNVHQNSKPEDVRRELAFMAAVHQPDVFVLTEASGQFGQLSGLGFRVVQLHPGRWPHGRPMPEDGNVAILVRKDLDIDARRLMRMNQRWIGPKHGIPHAPRVYRWVRVRKDGRVWKVGGFHWPFGQAAKDESDRRVRNWFRWTWPKRPVIAVGDMNMGAHDMRNRVANKVGSIVSGFGIDLTAFKNCHLIDQRNLGNHGSDHPAVLYVFEA